MDGNLIVKVSTRDGCTIVAPQGEVDMTGSPTLKVELRKASTTNPPPKKIVVDLTAVNYMDSSGLATLVDAFQSARRNNYPLVVCGLTTRVKAIFDIAKLALVFTIVPTLDDAIAH